MTKARIDFAIPFIAAFAVGALVNFVGGKVFDQMETQSEEIVYSDSKIGAAASENVPVVSSIAEMKEQDYFTFHTDSTDDYIYYDGTFYDIYELESGEVVLVNEYIKHKIYVAGESEAWWLDDGYIVMPIGKIVDEPLSSELLAEIEANGYTLTDTSFYIDMTGNFGTFDREKYEGKLQVLSFLIGLIVFFAIRYLMISSGLFPPLFPLRFLKSWKKYILYYGVIYYGEEVDLIIALRKQKNFDAAAHEFAKLANIKLFDAQKAIINKWDEIYGEGILHTSSVA